MGEKSARVSPTKKWATFPNFFALACALIAVLTAKLRPN
jgi:hypothetical protein